MEDRIGLLKRTYLFSSLSDEDLQLVSGLLKERLARSQSTIYRQGDPDASFYIVVSGRLKVWALDERGRQRTLNYLQRGDSFGTHSLLAGGRRDVTIEVDEPSVLLTLEKRDFDRLLQDHPHLRQALFLHIVDSLRGVPLFAELSTEDLQRIAAAMGQTRYHQGSTIYRQGELSTTFYIIEAGRVALLTREGSGEEQVIAHLRSGDFFGQRSLLTGQPRHTSVRATEDTRLFYLNKRDFDSLLEAVPPIRGVLKLEVGARETMVSKRFPWQREGEVLVALSHKHAYSLLRSLWVLVFPVLCLAAILFLARALAWQTRWTYVGCGLVAASAAGLVAWLWADWRNDYYVLTNKRVVHLEKTILVRESRDEAPLESIQDITILMPSVVGRLLGFNDLSIQTAGAKGRVLFKTVGNASWIRDRLFEQLERLKAEDKAEQRDAIRLRLQLEMGHGEAQGAHAVGQDPLATAESSPTPTDRSEDPTLTGDMLATVRSYFIPQMRIEKDGIVTWRKHWFRLVDRAAGPAVLLFMLGQVGAAAALGLVTPPARMEGFFWAALVIGVPLGLFLVWYRYEDWRNDVYQLTDDRIIDVERLPLGLREERREASLSMIQDIGYEIPGLIANLLDYGNVVIETAGREAVFTFSWVHQPRRVQEEVFARMDAFRQGERQRERERRTDELLDWFATFAELSREEGTTPDGEEQQ